MSVEGPDFAIAVPDNGYAWWYVDAVSDDRRYGITIIAFIGSVFSPYYAFARRKGPADPEDFCAMNVAVYGPGVRRWAMTERGRGALSRSCNGLSVGPSAVSWNGGALVIDFDEVAVPWPQRVRGRVKVHAGAVNPQSFTLLQGGAHIWRPIMPVARAEIALESPRLAWSGSAYFDHNCGAEPLDEGFREWTWSRSVERDATTIFYDVVPRSGAAEPLALRSGKDGGVARCTLPPAAKVPGSRWGVTRTVRSDAGSRPKVEATLEDAPFYARSLIASTVGDVPAMILHESLSLDRFRLPIVQAMLPFKMPRKSGPTRVAVPSLPSRPGRGP